MKFHLMRKPSGVLVISRSLGAQYEEIDANFQTSLRLFGKLVKPGEAINGAEWERRILERQSIGKVGLYIDAIRCCMSSYDSKPKVCHPPFGWPFVKHLVKSIFEKGTPVHE